MKRKRGNREGWSRIERQHFVQEYVEDQVFKGYVTLLMFEKVKQPLLAKYTPEPITLVQDGSFMLQHFPENKHYCLTTFISPEHKIIQWYIDIIDSIGMENGIVYMDDLYLDLIVFPDNTIVEKDIDEVEEALRCKDITLAQYEVAWQTFNELKNSLALNSFPLLKQAEVHFNKLLKTLLTNK